MPSGDGIASPCLSWRSAATAMSCCAMSLMRCLTRALRDGQPTPPRRLSWISAPCLPNLVPVPRRGDICVAVLMQYGAQAIGRAGAIGGDQHAPTGLRLAGEMIAHTVEQVDLRVGARLGEARPRTCAGIDGERRSLRRGKRVELADAPANERPAPFLLVEKGLLGPHRALNRRGAAAPGAHRLPPRLVVIGDGGDALMADILGLVVEHDCGIGQVVENRLQRLVVERQPMLHADVAPAGADRLVERIVFGDGAELLAVARPEALDGGR